MACYLIGRIPLSIYLRNFFMVFNAPAPLIHVLICIHIFIYLLYTGLKRKDCGVLDSKLIVHLALLATYEYIVCPFCRLIFNFFIFVNSTAFWFIMNHASLLWLQTSSCMLTRKVSLMYLWVLF